MKDFKRDENFTTENARLLAKTRLELREKLYGTDTFADWLFNSFRDLEIGNVRYDDSEYIITIEEDNYSPISIEDLRDALNTCLNILSNRVLDKSVFSNKTFNVNELYTITKIGSYIYIYL